MEGIINNLFSGQKYIQHEKLTSEDITDQSQVKDTSNAVETTESVLKKDVYIAGSASSDVCGMEKRQKVLTPDMASALAEKYDVKNMTRNEYGKLLQELRDSGVISSKDFSVGFGGEVPYTEPDGVQMILGSTDWIGIDTWPSGNEKVDFTKLLRACARYCTDFASKQEEGSDGEIVSNSLSGSYTRLLKIFEQIDSQIGDAAEETHAQTNAAIKNAAPLTKEQREVERLTALLKEDKSFSESSNRDYFTHPLARELASAMILADKDVQAQIAKELSVSVSQMKAMLKNNIHLSIETCKERPLDKVNWVLCPACNSKTRIKIQYVCQL